MYTLSLDISHVRVARRDVCASSWRNQINAGPRTVVRSLCLCRLTIAISPRPAQSQLEAANRPSRGRCYLEGTGGGAVLPGGQEVKGSYARHGLGGVATTGCSGEGAPVLP